jgi:hypothetical protein
MTPRAPEFDEFNPNNPYTAVALLGERVTNLGKELSRPDMIDAKCGACSRDPSRLANAIQPLVKRLTSQVERFAGLCVPVAADHPEKAISQLRCLTLGHAWANNGVGFNHGWRILLTT